MRQESTRSHVGGHHQSWLRHRQVGGVKSNSLPTILFLKLRRTCERETNTRHCLFYKLATSVQRSVTPAC